MCIATMSQHIWHSGTANDEAFGIEVYSMLRASTLLVTALPYVNILFLEYQSMIG